ncbi:serine acetyltransferase [Flavobacteriaceae bacterium]|nr:serine acetyltransferase [Flavobacteriaceae bacterium]
MVEKQLIDKLYKNFLETKKCITLKDVGLWFDKVIGVIYPVSKDLFFRDQDQFEEYLKTLQEELKDMMYCNIGFDPVKVPGLVDNFSSKIWDLKQALDLDIDAIYEGDPAAQSKDEIMRTYPGFLAIAAHRIAHFFYNKKLPVIPRMISEYAHSKTGIDIHPGAHIGSSFCIDHGTGVVIGETTIIGNHVKIYQGVTLGGLSVEKKLANTKRHPTIEDSVVIYSGASILGGDTVIGKNSIIGGNTFIIESIPQNSKIYHPSNS